MNTESLAELQSPRARVDRRSRGDAHYSRTSRLTTRGERHWTAIFPERVPRGSKAGNSKLTEEGVRDIRTRAAAGETLVSIATLYNVSKGTVSMVVSRKRWAHIP